MRVGELLRKTADPIEAILKETGGIKLFDGTVNFVKRETESGFTFVDIEIQGMHQYRGSTLELRAKNEVLVAYRDKKLVALAPDIITPVHFETGKCTTAEKIKKGDKLVVIGLSAPRKWITPRGLELWKDVLRRAGIIEAYVPIEQLAKA